MRDNAKVAVPVDGDGADALFELGGAAHLGAIFGIAGATCEAVLPV
jgi:hypothetical protein